VDETRALARSAAAPGVESRVADATALPFSDGSFDVVFGDHVLGHIPDAGRAVSECLRVLRKGGIAVFNGGNALRPDGWPLHHALSKKTYYKRSFFPYQLVGLFTGRGGTLLRSYGTLVFLDRGWRLLLPRKPKTDSGARTPAPPGLRKGLKRKIKAVLDRALPVWLKVEYGIVVTKA
jgi:SAM-dependent methyltransferase